jgi:hypothetical protein
MYSRIPDSIPYGAALEAEIAINPGHRNGESCPVQS